MAKISTEGKKIILFDGVCNLCNSSVNKLIRWDKKNIFLFASLQSDFGTKLIDELKLNTQEVDSIIYYQPGVTYEIKSNAILRIADDLGGFWKLCKIFYIIPVRLRNVFYDWVAKNRYKWYGKKKSCMIPTPELKARFLD